MGESARTVREQRFELLMDYYRYFWNEEPGDLARKNYAELSVRPLSNEKQLTELLREEYAQKRLRAYKEDQNKAWGLPTSKSRALLVVEQ